jgi:hypothetical protein
MLKKAFSRMECVRVPFLTPETYQKFKCGLDVGVRELRMAPKVFVCFLN